RKIRWSRAFENAIDIRDRLPVQIKKIEAVIDQAALGCRRRYSVDGRDFVARHQIDRRSAIGENESVSIEDHTTFGSEPRYDRIKLNRLPSRGNDRLHRQFPSSDLDRFVK